MLPPIYTLLIEIRSALAGSVAPQLRAITVDIDTRKKELIYFFFYDGTVTIELYELASVAITEVDLYTFEYTIQEHVVQLDYPQKIPIQGKLAFLRYEPELPEFKKENRAFLLKETLPVVVLLLDTQEALLGKVTPALRHVSVGVDTDLKQVIFSVTYDGPISQQDFSLARSIMKEGSVSFPGYEIISDIREFDAPKKPFTSERRCAYLRFIKMW
jgi:hypothetical protein